MRTVQQYYQSISANLGYFFVMHGSQHFGYYPTGRSNVSEWEAQKAHHDVIAKNLNLQSEDKVLDAGCGQGFVAADIATRYHCHITGIDITPYVVSRAQNRAKKAGLTNKTTFICGDYQALPFEDNSFDKIYTVETLCHAPNLEKALSEFDRVLKPGGKLVSMEYTQDSVRNFSSYEKKMYDIVVEGTSSPSLPLFTKDNYTKLLKKFIGPATQQDITDNFEPSLRRLYNMAKIPYTVIKSLHLQHLFVNSTIAVEFYQMAKKGLLGYSVYTAQKSGV